MRNARKLDGTILVAFLISLLFSRMLRMCSLSPPSAIAEAHPEVESCRSLSQRIALVIREALPFVQHEPIVLHDAHLHRRVERVPKAIPEREERVDASICGRKLGSV